MVNVRYEITQNCLRQQKMNVWLLESKRKSLHWLDVVTCPMQAAVGSGKSRLATLWREASRFFSDRCLLPLTLSH